MTRRLFHALVFPLLSAAALGQTSPSPLAPDSRQPFRLVSFDKVQALSGEDQRAIAQKLRQQDADWVTKQAPDALARAAEDATRSVYMDRGYWRAKVSAKVTWVSGQGGQRQVDAEITALDEGEQYWLKAVQWHGVTAIPQDELAQLLPIHAWELMSRVKLSEGLQSIRRFYATRGYIAFSAVPQLDFDDAAHSVVLNITVQEDSPFRFRNLAISGLDRAASRDLERQWDQMREQLYSPDRLRGFFEKYVPGYRPGTDPLDISTSNIDLDTHTVDIMVNFLPTTQAERVAQ